MGPRVFVALALALVGVRAEQAAFCASADCPIEGGIHTGEWWRQELNKAQPKCLEIDPTAAGTCHQWTVDLNAPAKEAVDRIKRTVSEKIMNVTKTSAKSRVLDWNDQMDELYLSAPKHGEGSDKVFITPHIDGFFGMIPFMVAYRCVYGLTGPHDTVTIQPMRNPEEQEVTLGAGDFTCFDYNREIHWIEHRADENSSNKERIVLKLHFYEYPVIFRSVAKAFGDLNAQYNFFARRAFLVSQFPDRSAFSRLVARVINGITLFGGRAEAFYGYMNIGIVLALAAGCRFRAQGVIGTVGAAHLVLYILAYLFRSVPLGMFIRDAVALKATSAVVLALPYLGECVRGGISLSALLSFTLVVAGTALSALAFAKLGVERTYFGAEFGAATCDPSQQVMEFPYGENGIPHPMILGSMLALTGARLHPTFGPKFSANYLIQMALYSAVLALEVFDVHVPSDMEYTATFSEFVAYHQDPTNVIAHLVTTGLGVVGVLGMVNNLGPRKASSSDATKTSASSSLPYLTLGWTWLLVRYTVPDEDVAYLVVGLMFLAGLLVKATNPPFWLNVLLLIASVASQEAAHMIANEVTYMAAYAEVTPKAALTFGLHNLWLLPFEVRAAINVLSRQFAPEAAL